MVGASSAASRFRGRPLSQFAPSHFSRGILRASFGKVSIRSELWVSVLRGSSFDEDVATKRLPLHLALAEGKPFSSIQPLFKAFPDALVEYDTSVTGLPAVCLAALQDPPLPHVIERIARGLRSSSWSVWQYLPSKTKELARHAAREECDRQQVDTIYQLLRQNPMVLSPVKSS